VGDCFEEFCGWCSCKSSVQCIFVCHGLFGGSQDVIGVWVLEPLCLCLYDVMFVHWGSAHYGVLC